MRSGTQASRFHELHPDLFRKRLSARLGHLDLFKVGVLFLGRRRSGARALGENGSGCVFRVALAFDVLLDRCKTHSVVPPLLSLISINGIESAVLIPCTNPRIVAVSISACWLTSAVILAARSRSRRNW